MVTTASSLSQAGAAKEFSLLMAMVVKGSFSIALWRELLLPIKQISIALIEVVAAAVQTLLCSVSWKDSV